MPIRIKMNLHHIAQSAPHWALWFAGHGWLANPLVFWIPVYAAVANRYLRRAKFGKKFVKWLSPAGLGSTQNQVLSAGVHSLVRWAAGFPEPEFVAVSEDWKVGEYLVGIVQNGMKPCVDTSPSAAVRLCLAMQERGISLRSVTFLLEGEPLTPSRRETIEAAGAKAVPTYGFSKGGNVGNQCPSPSAADDVHISLDA